MSAAITIAMPRMVPNQLLAEAHAKYPESLARAGAEMRWIELDDPEKAVQDALACDGLLLPGGGDIDPKFYGQERIPACGEPNVLRDTAEPLLLRAFRRQAGAGHLPGHPADECCAGRRSVSGHQTL